jgi:hypothetical protein
MASGCWTLILGGLLLLLFFIVFIIFIDLNLNTLLQEPVAASETHVVSNKVTLLYLAFSYSLRSN